MASLFEIAAGSTSAESTIGATPPHFTVQILKGTRSILPMQQALAELRDRTGQADNPLLRTEFFLGRVQMFVGNQPVVLLVYSPERLEAAVYLYEKTLIGLSTGYMRCFDHLTGESSVIAAQQQRGAMLKLAIHQLFVQTNARVAWATVSQGGEHSTGSREEVNHVLLESSTIGREHRLKLSDNFAATLSRFGQHTRRNLRYYRRRAEKELNVEFHAVLTSQQSDEAFRQLTGRSFQPFPVSLTEWRKMDGLLRTQPGYFAMGLRANGEWISYLFGMRSEKHTYALVQMNHKKFARYSLSTVLRSYFFEYEIERGQAEIKFVNGTCALFQRCCEPDTCFTVSARRGLAAFVVARWIAPWHSAPDHALNMPRWGDQTQAESQALRIGLPGLMPTQPKG